MVYFDKPYLQIVYDFSIRCAVNTWKGYLTDMEYQEALYQCAEIIRRTGATTIIANLRHLALSSELDGIYWTNLSWLSDMRVSEVKKIAFIVREHMLPQISSQEIITQIDDHFLVSRYFDTIEDAKSWVAERY